MPKPLDISLNVNMADDEAVVMTVYHTSIGAYGTIVYNKHDDDYLLSFKYTTDTPETVKTLVDVLQRYKIALGNCL